MIGLVPSILDSGPVDGAVLARFVAEHEVWPRLSGLPYESQRLVVQQYVFTSPELFDLLREKSRQEGRRDRQRGIELAELALLSLDVSAAALGERIHELRALGRAWLGNAKRLALDFPGAEEASPLIPRRGQCDTGRR